jgi:hypothetical protein
MLAISRLISSKHPIGQPPTEGHNLAAGNFGFLIEVSDGLER